MKAAHPIKPGDVYVTCASAEVIARFHVAVPGMAHRLAMSISTTLDKPLAVVAPRAGQKVMLYMATSLARQAPLPNVEADLFATLEADAEPGKLLISGILVAAYADKRLMEQVAGTLMARLDAWLQRGITVLPEAEREDTESLATITFMLTTGRPLNPESVREALEADRRRRSSAAIASKPATD